MELKEQTKDKKIVFLIEDDAFLVKAYQMKFSQEDIEVWVAKDGKEAMEYLKKEPPTVVLLDLMLPEVSGWDVLAAIRKDDRWKQVPIVIISNLGQEKDIERGKALGATEYTVKTDVPINRVVEIVKKYF